MYGAVRTCLPTYLQIASQTAVPSSCVVCSALQLPKMLRIELLGNRSLFSMCVRRLCCSSRTPQKPAACSAVRCCRRLLPLAARRVLAASLHGLLHRREAVSSTRLPTCSRLVRMSTRWTPRLFAPHAEADVAKRINIIMLYNKI